MKHFRRELVLYRSEIALFSTRIGYYCVMKVEAVNINFKKMALAFRKHVRLKALNAGSNIIYLKNGQLVEENPKDSSIQIRTSFFPGNNCPISEE